MGDELMDYTERCRLCIAGSKRLSIDIFSPEGKKCKLQAKINKYLSLKISEDDKLPSSICYQCLFRLETWVSFKKHCMDSDQTLKNWAFFCGAITPESYLNEANKSPENGSDTEKANTIANAGSRARTPPPPPPPPSVVATENSSASQQLQDDAPSSSASSSSSFASSEKTSKAKDSPLNGMTREPQARSSKPGRRKILRPNKAVISSPSKDERRVRVEVDDVGPAPAPAPRQPEPEAIKVEEQASDCSPALLVKRKRGRPSKAWLKERAAALKKMKEEADADADAVTAPPKSETKAKHKAVTELIELDDPDFGSMKFTLSVIDSATVTPTEKTVTVVYPESSTSASSGRLSSDSCFKEEFSGFNIPKLEPNAETGESSCSEPRVLETIQDRLSEATDSETSAAYSSPEKLGRKRHEPVTVSGTGSGSGTFDETEEKMDEIASPSVDDVRPAPTSDVSRFCPSPDRDIEPARVDEPEEHHPAGYSDVVDVEAPCSPVDLPATATPTPTPTATPTTTPTTSTYFKEEIVMETETQLDDDSDSDLAAPPMSPLSPPRVEFQLIELQMETQVEERNSGCEY